MTKTKDRIASGLGSILEWYDFSLYGFLAPVLGKVFFPDNLPAVAMIKFFAIYAIGFIARPMGSLLFGFIGDKYGKTKVLKLTPIFIAFSTFGIAVLPSYQSVGIYSPIALALLRIIQGFCIGGEFSNSIIYLCESVSLKNRYFLGSLGSCTGSMGLLMGSLVTSVCYSVFPYHYLLIFGWRIIFIFSALMSLMVYIFRRNLKEKNINIFSLKKQNPLIASFKNQKSDYVKAIGLTYLSATSYYFIFVFLPNFSHHHLSGNIATTFTANTGALLLHLLATIVFGIIADKIGGLLMLRFASIIFIIVSAPIFYLLVNFPTMFLNCINGFSLISALNAASLPGLLVSLLKPETRCTVFSFSFNLCFGILGGTVPFVGFFIFEKTNDLLSPIYYLIFSAIITLLTAFFIRNKEITA